MKKIVSLLLSIIIMFNFTAQAVPAFENKLVRTYESGGCAIAYTLVNEWDGNQQISISVTNNTDKTIRNWALKFDSTGKITDIWDAAVYKNDGKLCVIKNNGYNYEIVPNGTVEFGFQIAGDDLDFPESISLCNKTVDSTDSAEFSYEITDSWNDGFVASVSITNTSDETLEAWRLSFNGNFDITNLWNVNRLYSEDGFLVENDVTTTPIAKGETKTFGFQGAISLGETPIISDFVLTSVVIDDEAEQPDISDILKEHLILCFGKYIEEEKAIDIYCSSTAEGVISIYEKDDEVDWTWLADVESGDSYKYAITEDFLVKQIKAVQETEKGIIQSEPFAIALTENGYTCKWLDRDNDGLPDYAESIYDTDPENPDTDGDGLTDYEEIYITGTNPIKYDTDENGVNDADDDIDSDGLSNREEIDLGTNPSNADTDGDDLSDGDEVNKYNTDPLKADSDEDTLNDGDEIAVGLDPNNPETFGVPDAGYKIEQAISSDSEALSDVNTDESPYELSLEISASGNAGTQLKSYLSGYSAVTDSSARLGNAVDLSYLNGVVDKVKLTYKIDDDYISNADGKYADDILDFQGIKRYNIFRYFDEINMLLPVATTYDEEKNTISAETDELGTYCVLDMEVLLHNTGVLSDDVDFHVENVQAYSAYSAAPYGAETDDNDFISVTFIIDRRNSIDRDDFDEIKNEIDAFAKRAFLYERNCEINLISQETTNFEKPCFKYIGSYSDYNTFHRALTGINRRSFSYDEDIFYGHCIISEALDEAVKSAVSNAENYIFDIYTQDKAIYEESTASSILENAISNNIYVSLITEYDSGFDGFQKELVSSTNGLLVDRFNSFCDEIYEFVWSDKDQIKAEPYYAITSDGYNEIKLDSKLYPNGYWKGLNPDADTDKDGLTDWDEVITWFLNETEDGYELPTVKECKDKLQYVPFYVQEAFDSDSDLIELFGELPILPICSDPTSDDGDRDGLPDVFEKAFGSSPLNSDTDGDGVSDYTEYIKGLNPLSVDTDHDGIPDGEDENPDTYDKSWKENAVEWMGYLFDFSEGVILGDFIQEPNMPQLIGVILGSYIPLIDIRDVIANLSYGDYLFAGISAMGLIPAIGDATKTVGKIADFISIGTKNTDEIVGILKFADNTLPTVYDELKHTDEFLDCLKRLPCKEAAELFTNEPAIQKVLKIASKGSSADEIVDVFKRLDNEDTFKLFRRYVLDNNAVSIADYEKGYKTLLKNVSGFEDDIAGLIKGLDETQSLKALELCAEKGEGMLKAIEKCGVGELDLLEELARDATKKVTWKDVEFVAKTPDGNLLWLEYGNEKAGLYHILYGSLEDPGHIDDFAKRGIDDVKAFLYNVVQMVPIEAGQDVQSSGRIFMWAEYLVDGKKYRLAFGDNGFIVSFYPNS